MNRYAISKIGLAIGVLMIFLNACTAAKKATYFNDLGDGTIESDIPLPEPIIQKSDILSISVTSLNAEATIIFNTSTSVSNANAQLLGYLVAPDGTIQFPVLGTIKADGLTKAQLKEVLTSCILDKKLLLEPNVTIRFLNFRITVLGEVAKPATVTVASEKISLLEAIGLAGDMTIYAKRDNVMVIREANNKKIIKRLDLNSQELFTSPYYYLQSNDIVYVAPNRAKIASAKEARIWLPTVMSALALIFSIVKYN